MRSISNSEEWEGKEKKKEKKKKKELRVCIIWQSKKRFTTESLIAPV
jgi:hypothetical protein